jgi:undecaprenyl diphosphate synthase
MGLLEKNIDENADELIEKGIRIIFLGDKGALSKKLAEKMEKLEEKSAHNKAILNVAVNYGARDELVHAVNTLLKEKKSEITAEDINAHLYTKNSPDPDLIIRTAGEKRLSNFLLWQAAYSEFYYSDKLWPDFTPDDVDEALENFMSRHRKFGGY